MLLIGNVGVFDLRMIGLARGIPMRALHRLVPWGIGGYALMAVAGFNVLVFYRFVWARVAAADAGEDAPRGAKIAGAVSLTCWVGVIVCGRLITYYRPPYHWCFWC